MSAPRSCFMRGALAGATVAGAATVLLAGCSGEGGVSLGTPPGTDAGGAGMEAGPMGDTGPTPDGSPAGSDYSLTTGPIMIDPGAERVVCVDRRVTSDHATDIVNISSELTQGGHHLVLYKSDATQETTTPAECRTFQGVFSGSVPLYIAQKAHTELQFPNGVAYTLPAGQMMRIELHFLNTTSNPLAVTGTVHLGEATSGTVVDHANLLFYGNLNINIPPQSSATVGPTFHAFRASSPHLFGLTGHEHHRGTGVTIEVGSPGGAMTPLYANNDWAEPPLTIFDPPIATSPGQGLRYTCTYFNPTNQTISFGESADQEMCFLWAYYYPDMGFELGFGN